MSYTQWRDVHKLDEMAATHGFEVAVDYNDKLKLRSQIAGPGEPGAVDGTVTEYCLLPVYGPSAVLAVGTVTELMYFLYGWETRKQYTKALGLEKATARKEQKLVNEIQLRATFKVLKETKNS